MIKNLFLQWKMQWKVWGLLLMAIFFIACAQPDDLEPENNNGNNNGNNNEVTSTEGSTINMLISDDPIALNGLTRGFTASAAGDNLLVIVIEWSIVSKPVNSRAIILNADSPTPSFRPDIVGEYVLKVVVSQGGSVLADNEVTIIVGVDDLFPAKPANHIPSTDDCMSCHAPDSWIIPVMDHTQVIGACDRCHNGIDATGQDAAHIPTKEQCEVCHNTSSWLGIKFDHTAAIGRCLDCHNGVDASGRSALHPNTTDICEACHFTAFWNLVITPMDHNQVFGTCVSCHSVGGVATGKPANHVLSEDLCENCHDVPPAPWINTFNDVPTPPIVRPVDPNSPAFPPAPDHSDPKFVGNCITCHDGIQASGQSVTHIATTNSCDTCHLVAPAAWVVLMTVDHTQILGTCVSCHDGKIASGKSLNHIVSANLCEVCHQTAPANWVPVVLPIDHAVVVGVCSDCHTQPAGHVAPSKVCEECHVTRDWITIIQIP